MSLLVVYPTTRPIYPITRRPLSLLSTADIRREFEGGRGSPLSPGERRVFRDIALDYCTRRIDVLEDACRGGGVVDLDTEGLDKTGQSSVSRRRKLATQQSDASLLKENDVAAAAAQFASSKLAVANKVLNNINSGTLEKSVKKYTTPLPDRGSHGRPAKDTSSKKYTFKRVVDSNTNETPSPPSAKRAKFRQENPLRDIPASTYHRNQLTLFDSNELLDFDTLPSPPKENAISRNKKSPKVISKAEDSNACNITPKTNKKQINNNTANQKLSAKKSATKLNCVPETRVGVWLSSRDTDAEASNVIRKEKSVDKAPFNTNKLSFQIDDPFSDDDVETINETDAILSEASEQRYGSVATARNTTQISSIYNDNNNNFNEPVTRNNCISHDAINASPLSSNSSAANVANGWLHAKNKRKQQQTTRRNGGGSTVVVLASDDEHATADGNNNSNIHREALNASVSIGCFHHNNGEMQSPVPPASASGGGRTLGGTPLNKFGLHSVGAAATGHDSASHVDATSSEGSDVTCPPTDVRVMPINEEETINDQVECPLCSGEGGGRAMSISRLLLCFINFFVFSSRILSFNASYFITMTTEVIKFLTVSVSGVRLFYFDIAVFSYSRRVPQQRHRTARGPLHRRGRQVTKAGGVCCGGCYKPVV